MTIENIFTFPLMESALSVPPSQMRTRNHSGGSTGSQGSSGSSSSYGSEKSLSALPHELLAYHLSRVQLGAVPQQTQLAPRHNERTMSCPSDRSSQSSQCHKNVNPARYKTEMCRPFEENGHCKYGDKCQFAHGINELRNLSRHPKYKTELCRTYHTVGFCPYGPRCHFIHNEDDLKLCEITHMKHQQVLKQVAQQVVQQQQALSCMALSHAPVESAKRVPMPPMSQPCQVPRPKSLDFQNLSLPMSSLGSTIDSPPASIADSSSPSLSPTSMMSDDVFNGIPTPPPGFSALPQVPVSQSGVFNFHDIPTTTPNLCLPSPLNISDNVSALAAGLQATMLNSKPKSSEMLPGQFGSLFSAPPTPPLSVDSCSEGSMPSESPEVTTATAKGPRLPIFSMLATFKQVHN